MKTVTRDETENASANITRRIAELADWRGETLARVRQLIHDADPEIEEVTTMLEPAFLPNGGGAEKAMTERSIHEGGGTKLSSRSRKRSSVAVAVPGGGVARSWL